MRLLEKFSHPDFKLVHSFPLKKLIVFGNDIQEELWFGWLVGPAGNQTEFPIYALDESEKAPPPTKVASSFVEFVEKVALGSEMKKLGLKKYTEKTQDGAGSEEEDEEEDENESEGSQDAEAEEDLLFLKTFRPFPAARGSELGQSFVKDLQPNIQDEAERRETNKDSDIENNDKDSDIENNDKIRNMLGEMATRFSKEIIDESNEGDDDDGEWQ